MKVFFPGTSRLVAIEALFYSYYPRLCDFSLRLIRDPDTAEDIVQDVFATICESPEKLPNESSKIKSFLYTCVKNACFNRLRHQTIVDRYRESYLPHPDTDSDIIDHIIHAEILGELYDAINALPKGCAAVFRKGYLEGLDNAEIAKQLNISIHTVKSQKQRGLSLLRKKLNPEVYGLILFIIGNQ